MAFTSTIPSPASRQTGVARLVALLVPLVLVGCRTDLVPAPSAVTSPVLDDAAVDAVNGVRLVAQQDEWPGPFPIDEEITPIHVIVYNDAGAPMRIRYDAFALVASDGRRFSAIPPFDVGGGVYEGVTVPNPYFAYEHFALAPHYSAVYDGVPLYDAAFPYDPYYYDAYYGAYDIRLAEVKLPTREMLQRALPEGVLSRNGRLDGYLYFQRIPDDVRRVTFRADIVRADTGVAHGEIRIPFDVE
jgi:hypothetical protein